MDNGMEAMLETYLYETNSLLDALDELLVNDEKIGDFSSDDVNEIFRSMHTIKGSSAMMEFNSLSTIAHHIEDLFFYIRDKGIESLDPEHKKELFDLMFRSGDYLRSEVQKVEEGSPLSAEAEIDSFANEINAFLKKISNVADESAEEAAPEAPASGEKTAVPGMPDDPDAAAFLHIYLEEGSGMENLYAFMIINALQDAFAFRCYPPDVETNPDTSAEIVENGFYIAFDSQDDVEQAESILKSQAHIRSYEMLENPGKKAEAAAPVVSDTKAQEAPPAKKETPASAGQAAAAPAKAPAAPAKAHAPVKQNLISVNVMKLDSLLDIVGELVITESMVTSAPELNQLSRDSFDNFMKSARQLRKLTDDLQDIAMSLRMVPISGVFQKMNRIAGNSEKKY